MHCIITEHVLAFELTYMCKKILGYSKGHAWLPVNSEGGYRRVVFLSTDLISTDELNNQLNTDLLPRKSERSIISYHGDQRRRKSPSDETRRKKTTD